MTLHRKLTFWPIVAALIAVLLLPAGASGRRVQTLNVTINYASPTAIFALPQIALDRNLFPSNLNVRVNFATGAQLVAPQATGQVQFTLIGSPSMDLAVASSGASVRWLAQWNVPNDNQMVVRRGINSLRDLKGKRFGITIPGSFVHLLQNHILRVAGAKPNEFVTLNLGTIPALHAAFISGQIDAIITSPPVTEQMLEAVPGSKVIFDFYERKFQWVGAGIVGYMPWVRQHPGATVAILRALNRALILFRTNERIGKDAIRKISGLRDEKLIDFAYKAAKARTPGQLQPVSMRTERNVLKTLRVNGFSQAKSSLAEDLLAPQYIRQVHKTRRR